MLVGSWVKVWNTVLCENIDASPFVYCKSEILTAF